MFILLLQIQTEFLYLVNRLKQSRLMHTTRTRRHRARRLQTALGWSASKNWSVMNTLWCSGSVAQCVSPPFFCRWSVMAAPCFAPKCYVVLCCIWQIVSLWVWREGDNKLSGKWWRNISKKGKEIFLQLAFKIIVKTRHDVQGSTVNITLLKHSLPFEIQLIIISLMHLTFMVKIKKKQNTNLLLLFLNILLFPTPSLFIYSSSILMAFLGIEILAYGWFRCISQWLFSFSISIKDSL